MVGERTGCEDLDGRAKGDRPELRRGYADGQRSEVVHDGGGEVSHELAEQHREEKPDLASVGADGFRELVDLSPYAPPGESDR